MAKGIDKQPIEEKNICESCKSSNGKGSNFCSYCGSKLKQVCCCWVKKKAYNCGHSECLGYRLFSKEKLQTD